MSNRNLLKKLSPIHIVAFVCAVLVFAAVVTSSVIFIINALNSDSGEFDYMTEDISGYLTYEKELGDIEVEFIKNYEAEIATKVDNDILKLVSSQKNLASGTGSEYRSDIKMTVGDQVNIYYRGYTLNDDKTKNYFEGGTNLVGKSQSSMTAYSLTIGGGQFTPGFESQLAGKTVGAFPNLKDLQVTDGSVANNQIIFVTYTRCELIKNDYSHVVTDGTAESATAALIDLNDGEQKINETYGEDFYEYIVGKTIGTSLLTDGDIFDTKIDGKDYKYTSLKVEYALASDYYDETTYQPIKVVFPYNYGTEELNGEVAYFEIFVDSVKEYGFVYGNNHNYEGDMGNTAFVDEIINNYFNKKANAELKGKVDANEDETVTREEYAAYLTAEYTKTYTENFENLRDQAILDALVKNAKLTDAFFANETLKALHDAKYTEFLVSFRASYNSYVTNNSLDSTVYTIEDYAKEAFDVEPDAEGNEWDGFTWKDEVKKLADTYFKDKLLVAMIYRDAEAGLAAKFDAKVEELMNEYKEAYLEKYGFESEDDMTTAEKDAYKADLRNYRAFLNEEVYYGLVVDYARDRGAITYTIKYNYGEVEAPADPQ